MCSITDSIYNEPEKWKDTEHTFVHESGLEVWTANGFWFIRIYEGTRNFPLWRKFIIWRAYRWWLKNAPLEALA